MSFFDNMKKQEDHRNKNMYQVGLDRMQKLDNL